VSAVNTPSPTSCPASSNNYYDFGAREIGFTPQVAGVARASSVSKKLRALCAPVSTSVSAVTRRLSPPNSERSVSDPSFCACCRARTTHAIQVSFRRRLQRINNQPSLKLSSIIDHCIHPVRERTQHGVRIFPRDTTVQQPASSTAARELVRRFRGMQLDQSLESAIVDALPCVK
jgi:hypothetical protein